MTQNQKKIPEMEPVFSLWAETHSLEDAIKRFRSVMAEYQILACVQKYLESKP